MIDTVKLLTIAQNLSDYGVDLSRRTSAPDADVNAAMGRAFIEISEAIGDITTELARRN